MSDTDTFDVKVVGPHGVSTCRLDVSYRPSRSITFVASDGSRTTFSVDEDSDFFECLKDLRRHLEKQQTLLLCNGARVDAYPSRMSRQMGAAMRVSLLTLGKQGEREDMVSIFGEAPVAKIGSIEAQRAFHKEWLRSLGWDIPEEPNAAADPDCAADTDRRSR